MYYPSDAVVICNYAQEEEDEYRQSEAIYLRGGLLIEVVQTFFPHRENLIALKIVLRAKDVRLLDKRLRISPSNLRGAATSTKV